MVSTANAATHQTQAIQKKQPTPRLYVYGSYVDEPLMMKAGQNKYYYATNHLYSVAALTDSTGAVVERYKYDAYGRQGIMNTNGTVSYSPSDYGNFVGFTGRYHDWETGLVYFRARYYDTGLGRFIGRDPLGYVDGMGLYGAYYVPNQLDPDGEACEAAVASVAATVGAIEAITETMANLQTNILRRERDLNIDPSGGLMPETVPGDHIPGNKGGDSRDGHRRLIAEDRANLRRYQGTLKELDAQLPRKRAALAACLAESKVLKYCKKIPFIGIIAAAMSVGDAMAEKGTVLGLVDTGLNAIPLFGTAKGIAEDITGTNMLENGDLGTGGP